MPPTIVEVCVPRADVLACAITESDFAADPAQVIRGSAPAVRRRLDTRSGGGTTRGLVDVTGRPASPSL